MVAPACARTALRACRALPCGGEPAPYVASLAPAHPIRPPVRPSARSRWLPTAASKQRYDLIICASHGVRLQACSRARRRRCSLSRSACVGEVARNKRNADGEGHRCAAASARPTQTFESKAERQVPRGCTSKMARREGGRPRRGRSTGVASASCRLARSRVDATERPDNRHDEVQTQVAIAAIAPLTTLRGRCSRAGLPGPRTRSLL